MTAAATPALRHGFTRVLATRLSTAAKVAPTPRPTTTARIAETTNSSATARPTTATDAPSATRRAIRPLSLSWGTNRPATAAARTAA